MAPRRLMFPVALALLPVLLAGCFDEPPIPPTGEPVFYDAFTTGFTPISFDPAQGAVPTALSVDKTKAQSGTASIRIDVPAAPQYAGAAVVASDPQDLTSTNALVFWATASRDVVLNIIGYGLAPEPDPSSYVTLIQGLPLTTEWTRHLIPVPDPARLTAIHGMLFYSLASSINYTTWLDDVKFDTVDPAIMGLQPAVLPYTATMAVGGTATVDLSMSYSDFDGTVRQLESGDVPGSGPAPAFFSFASSNPAIASVDSTGKITGVLVGQATVTARLKGLLVPGTVTVNVLGSVPTAPLTAAPVPTVAAANVISLYTSSNTYPSRPVATWGTSWSNDGAGPFLTTPTIAGTSSVVKKYTSMQYVGVDFSGARIDASAMTTMHVDLWTPNASQFGVKLVGWDGGVQGAEAQVIYTSRTIKPYSWISLEIPLSRFAGVNLASLGLLLWLDNNPNATEKGTFFIDNVYFHN
jgi:hypothetical protein